MENNIKDLLEMSALGKANNAQLIIDAYNRGLIEGKEIAEKKAIEAIEQEK